MHIFIAIGQTHLNNFETLLRNGLVPKEETVLVVDNTTIYNESLWSKVLKAPISFNNNASSKLQQLISISKKAKAYAGLIKELKQYKDNDITVYLAYIEDILSNYMFFNFSEKTKVVIVEDGTLNYYNHTFQNVAGFKFLLKQQIAKIYRIPFKKYAGHSSGASYDRVQLQYLTLPQFAFVQRNIAQLPVVIEKLKTIDQKSLFIIGQEAFCNVVGQEDFMVALKAKFKALKKQPFYNSISTIYYKPHRNGIRLTQDFLSDFFPNKKVILVITSLTAEEYYFTTLNNRYIASFNSSTLINIYTALDDKDRKKLDIYVYPITMDELTPLFKRMKFHFLKNVS